MTTPTPPESRTVQQRTSCDLCEERAYIFGSTAGGENIQYCARHYDDLKSWQRALDEQANQAAGGREAQTCPRRMNEMGPWEPQEMLDTWEVRSNAYGTQRRCCSFCGSIHPDDFMQLVGDGRKLFPTSKSYKVYLPPDHDKFYFMHLSPDQQRQFVGWANEGRVKTDGPWNPLPYFIGTSQPRSEVPS